MEKVLLRTKCPNCKNEIQMEHEYPSVALDIAPEVRSQIKPIGDALIYKITSDDIREFIFQKSQLYVPGIKVVMDPIYCEKKRRNKRDVHRSYASLRIGFSANAVDTNQDLGWFEKIGMTDSNIRIVEGLYKNIIDLYKYDKNEINSILDNEKEMEIVEEAFGMNRDFVEKIRAYVTPRAITDSHTNRIWVLFSAAAENVLKDMLTDKETCKINGSMEIQDVYKISDNSVEFLVYVNSNEVRSENPFVRKILQLD